MGEWVYSRLHEFVDVAGLLNEGRFVYASGTAVGDDDPYGPHTFVWFHRDLSHEQTVPGAMHIVHRDERIVVIDKPAFLSSIPRGRHVMQSVVVRLRADLGLPELSPLHRLDRVTSGLLMLATERRWRAPYQMLFQEGRVEKTYLAQAPIRDGLDLPVIVRNHVAKERGHMQGRIVATAPANSESLIELQAELADGSATYRLSPRTGRTHQLRLHMLSLGIPICGDPLYPVDRQVPIDDFRTPLQLLASKVRFTDPVDGRPRRFDSVRSLPLGSEAVHASPRR
jgi:tRNA pseudouridine32 synthase/23S rRNA pseudouridine746 synthase